MHPQEQWKESPEILLLWIKIQEIIILHKKIIWKIYFNKNFNFGFEMAQILCEIDWFVFFGRWGAKNISVAVEKKSKSKKGMVERKCRPVPKTPVLVKCRPKSQDYEMPALRVMPTWKLQSPEAVKKYVLPPLS